MQTLDLTCFNFESYSRNDYKVTLTLRRSGERRRARVVMHLLDFRKMLATMRDTETYAREAAQNVLDTAEGKAEV